MAGNIGIVPIDVCQTQCAIGLPSISAASACRYCADESSGSMYIAVGTGAVSAATMLASGYDGGKL